MKPRTPDSVRGLPLNAKQRDRLATIIDMISEVNPGRKASANLSQALGTFLMTVRRSRGQWIDRTSFRLDNGRGPVVVPSWAAAE